MMKNVTSSTQTPSTSQAAPAGEQVPATIKAVRTRQADCVEPASPAIIKGQLWFPAYNAARSPDAATSAKAMKQLDRFIADDVLFYQGLGGVTGKAQYLAEAKAGTYGQLDASDFSAKKVASFELNGAAHQVLVGSEKFTIPAFGLVDAPATFLNLWRREMVDGTPAWRMVTHLSTFETNAALQPHIDAVVAVANGAQLASTTLHASRTVAFKGHGGARELVAGSVVGANGKTIDVLALLEKRQGQWVAAQASARTRT